MDFHLYADDTQIYLPIKNIPEPKAKLSSLLSNINIWMNSRKLKLNTGKTEIMIIHGSNRHNPAEEFGDFQFENSTIKQSLQLKNIGITFDPALKFDSHINNIAKACNFQLHNIAAIRKFLDKQSLLTLIH